MFTTDDRATQFLKFNGIQNEYHDTVTYAELHPDWKLTNIGRRDKIDQDAVLDYGCRMEAGSAAPAVIVIPGKSGYAVLDGVQRLCAGEELGATTFSAYVVSPRTSTQKQHIIRICANAAINGQHTPEKSHILETAVRILHFEDHCSAAEIGRVIGRTAQQVDDEIHFQRTVKLIQGTGYTGKLASRSQKWFAALVGKASKPDDWQAAPDPLCEMLHLVEKCKFKNGAATPLVEDFFDIRRSAKKDRPTQFYSKLKNMKNTPEVRERLSSRKPGRRHLDDVLPRLRAASTVIERAVEAAEVVHDGEFANALAECVRVIYVNCKQLVPRDLQYPDGKHSSIFSKG